MLLEGIEVSVAMKQLVATDYASSSQHHVDSAANRDTKISQFSIVLRCFNHHVFAPKNYKIQARQKPPNFIELLVELAPLKHLREYQVANCKLLRIEQPFKEISLRRGSSSKVVDPNTRIHQNHLSRLMASRSPSQVIFPRNFRISVCCLRRSKVLSPSSTASRFVRRPVARKVSAMSLSSITMLVRIVCTLSERRTHYTAAPAEEPPSNRVGACF